MNRPLQVVLLGAAAVLFLGGCATYRPQPLPASPDLVAAAALNLPAEQFKLPGLAPRPFDPAGPLDETAVMTLAVLNNPSLKAQRLRAGVAGAQLFAAGLLPDPELSVGLSRSAEHAGYDVGLAADLQAIVTRGARQAAAAAHARQVNLELLWQEWQVAEQARELYIDAVTDGPLLRMLGATVHLLTERYQRDAAALQRSAITVGNATADYTAMSEAAAQLRDLQLKDNTTQHALRELLGLRPDAALRLGGIPDVRLLSHAELTTAVAEMPRRRADLLALQAGYASEEQNLRAAILAQFPAVTVGVDRARSAEEGVGTSGFSISVALPLFNRNRGQIATERATRAVLRQEYLARLDHTVSTADEAWHATRILARQWRELGARLPDLEQSAAAAEREFRSGNLDLATYTALRANLISRQSDRLRLRAALARAQGALELELGLPPGGIASAEERSGRPR